MEVQIGWGDLLLIAPMIVVFLFSCVPITVKVLNGNVEPRPGLQLLVVMIGLLVAGVVGAVVGGNPEPKAVFEGALVVDGMSSWINYLVIVATAASIFLAYEHPAIKGRQFSEFLFLILNCAVGMMVLASASDLVTTFIGIEMMSLPLYLIIALSHEERYAKEAAFKYFILGSLASALFLYGVAFLFGTTGTTELKQLAAQLPDLIAINRMALIGVVFVIVGFGFKVGLVPFHSWAPDVYQGSATPLTAFMSTAVKAVTFVAFLRFLLAKPLLSAGSEQIVDLLQWLAVLTMLVGNIGAIMQSNLKRILAYSSVAHSGYLMVGLLAAAIGETPQAGTGPLLFYLVSYAITSLGTFAFICVLEKHEGSLVSVDDLKGLAAKHPALCVGLAVGLLSLAGVPPLLGFFAKFSLFAAAIDQGLLWLALWGVVNSVISVYYYLRPIVAMWMQAQDREGDVAQPGYLLTRVTLAVTSAVLVIGGIFASPLYSAIQFAVSK